MITFYDEKDIISFGEKLGNLLEPDTIITLKGDLGAGKTTLTKGIGKALGITKVINSPTFTILKVYEGKYTLYHFDAYRLEESEEELGFEELFEMGGVCVIEWPDFIEDILPKERLEINISINDDASRTLSFRPVGEYYKHIVEVIND